ncbi:hypothetical protein [Flavihumibacter sp. UBA7668]|uniref:hypothetical protein n=1 Tax=Flavihumibacter sp. UBA7668 TaxID=1946542 RepID=UPI0025C0229B|nr:hypothetical protein [Flavihumibacter sp. UBA7668]
MRRVVPFLSALFFLLSACQKVNNQQEELTGEAIVTVKLIDAMCSSVILQIQEDSLKKFGEQQFHYKGKTYDGIFSSSMNCPIYSQPAVLAVSGSINEATSFKVLISKTAPASSSCEMVTCQAVLSNMPGTFYHVYPIR